MEFDELVVKESPGLCRCCLSEGCYKDLGSEYTWMSETEVYADMLLECFDISITQHTEGPNGPSRLICEVCITRLRDACNFKKQVLDSEKKFVDMVGRGEFGQKVMIYQTSMRLEGDGTEAGEVEYLDDDMHFDDADDEPLRPPTESTQAVPEPSASDEIIISTLKVKGKRGRPRKVVTDKVEKKPKLSRTEDKPMTSKAVKAVKGSKLNPSEHRHKKMEMIRKLMVKRRNIEYVLQYSNATPFLWNKGRFKCFYCLEQMKDLQIIQEHSLRVHQFANIELVVHDRTKNNRSKDAAVKIDITNLVCKLCEGITSFVNLDELIHHLIISHDAEYDMSVPNCLLPFKLNEDQPTCPTCNMKFVFFEYLLRHANKHHLAHAYMCDICGTSFQGENHLRMHTRYYHKEGGYECKYCGEILDTLSKKILHEKNLHLANLQSCPQCPETFKSPYLRKQHLANVHGVEEMKIKCPYCVKTFPQESIMSRHMRRVHLREKNVECEICKEKFFGPYDLKLHMARHNGEKRFACELCDKRFAKRSNLNSHLIMHSGVKKFVCEICNKAFGQSNNLKLHIKNRHSVTIPEELVEGVGEGEEEVHLDGIVWSS